MGTISAYDLIRTVDYNSIQTAISTVLGTGSGSSGYGQTVQSSPVVEGDKVTEEQWDALRYDLVNARIHQTGVVPTITDIEDGEILSYSSSYEAQYTTLSDSATTDKLSIASGQYVTETGATYSQTVSFSNYAQVSFTITFANANTARFFFNSGGKIRFTSTFSPTASFPTTQERTWRDTLSGTSAISFGATGGVNFYTLTTSDQTFSTTSNSSPYSNNYWYLRARCNVADNSNGGATTVTFTSLYQDNYTDPGPPSPGDGVTGTMALTVTQQRAYGSLYPSLVPGSFSIAGPTYGSQSWATSGTPT